STSKCLSDPKSPFNGYRVIGVLFANTYYGIEEWSTIESIAKFTSFTTDTTKSSTITSKRPNYKSSGSKGKDFAIIKSTRRNMNAIHLFKDQEFYSKASHILPAYISYNDTLEFKNLN